MLRKQLIFLLFLFAYTLVLAHNCIPDHQHHQPTRVHAHHHAATEGKHGHEHPAPVQQDHAHDQDHYLSIKDLLGQAGKLNKGPIVPEPDGKVLPLPMVVLPGEVWQLVTGWYCYQVPPAPRPPIIDLPDRQPLLALSRRGPPALS